MSAPTGRTALYRFYDEYGDLLYVGISCDPDYRFRAHRTTLACWYDFHKRVVVDWFSTRAEAERAERQAIVCEKPAWNIRHAGRDQEWLDQREARIEERRRQARRLPPISPARQRRALEIAAALAAAPKVKRLQEQVAESRRRASRELADIRRAELKAEAQALLAQRRAA